MRILVTGAAGFIGSHVAEAFHRAGHEVVGLDNLSTGKRENLPSEINLVVMDLADEARLETLFRDFQPEVVSHHAAQVNVRVSWDKPAEDARANILGSLALLGQATRGGTQKIIYSSSGGAAYGEPTRLPVAEDHPVHPLSNYGVSKYTTELYLRSFQASGGLRYVILRYPNVYGPRQDPHGEAGVVAIFTENFLTGTQPTINGDGKQTRDYVFVSDVARANLLALEADHVGPINIGTGRETDVNTLFGLLKNLTTSSLPEKHHSAKPGEQQRSVLNCERAARVLGWRPQVELKEGLGLTVEHFRDGLHQTQSTISGEQRV